MLTILKWLNVNKLSLNLDKTKILIFDNANFSVKMNLSDNYDIKEYKSFNHYSENGFLTVQLVLFIIYSIQ